MLGQKHIAKALERNTGQQILDVSLNGIYDEGGKAMIRALKANITVKELDLGDNLSSTAALNELKIVATQREWSRPIVLLLAVDHSPCRNATSTPGVTKRLQSEDF
jgi:hypothetical protein